MSTCAAPRIIEHMKPLRKLGYECHLPHSLQNAIPSLGSRTSLPRHLPHSLQDAIPSLGSRTSLPRLNQVFCFETVSDCWPRAHYVVQAGLEPLATLLLSAGMSAVPSDFHPFIFGKDYTDLTWNQNNPEANEIISQIVTNRDASLEQGGCPCRGEEKETPNE